MHQHDAKRLLHTTNDDENLAHIHLSSADGINTIGITLFMHYMLLLETAHWLVIYFIINNCQMWVWMSEFRRETYALFVLCYIHVLSPMMEQSKYKTLGLSIWMWFRWVFSLFILETSKWILVYVFFFFFFFLSI